MLLVCLPPITTSLITLTHSPSTVSMATLPAASTLTRQCGREEGRRDSGEEGRRRGGEGRLFSSDFHSSNSYLEHAHINRWTANGRRLFPDYNSHCCSSLNNIYPWQRESGQGRSCDLYCQEASCVHSDGHTTAWRYTVIYN